MKDLIPIERIEQVIFLIRGHRVILDADLARLYGVPTYRFNEAFKRNRHRFPEDFAFQLTTAEYADLRSQNATTHMQGVRGSKETVNSSQIAMSSSRAPDDKGHVVNRSQFATGSSRHRGVAYRPWAFTEHGALMAANILRSKRAGHVSVFVVRAFVRLRALLAAHKELDKKLTELERRVESHDTHIQSLFDAIRELMTPIEPPSKPRRIGFRT
jgi:hypothetical protein